VCHDIAWRHCKFCLVVAFPDDLKYCMWHESSRRRTGTLPRVCPLWHTSSPSVVGPSLSRKAMASHRSASDGDMASSCGLTNGHNDDPSWVGAVAAVQLDVARLAERVFEMEGTIARMRVTNDSLTKRIEDNRRALKAALEEQTALGMMEEKFQECLDALYTASHTVSLSTDVLAPTHARMRELTTMFKERTRRVSHKICDAENRFEAARDA